MQAQGFPLRRYPALAKAAAAWFSAKWGLPQQSYRDSIRACLGRDAGVPQWYVVPDGKGGIAAGTGLIENDFHDRPDLAPNVCALYVERAYRGRGLARALLRCIREDAARMGITTLYPRGRRPHGHNDAVFDHRACRFLRKVRLAVLRHVHR